MSDFLFPRIPYDHIRSEFIRDEIGRGDFSNVEYRRYVNKLVWIEWYTTEGLSPSATGISGFGAAVQHWQLAAEYPKEYDIIRREFGATTRDEHRRKRENSSTEELSDEGLAERRQQARRHAHEWRAVQEE